MAELLIKVGEEKMLGTETELELLLETLPGAGEVTGTTGEGRTGTTRVMMGNRCGDGHPR